MDEFDIAQEAEMREREFHLMMARKRQGSGLLPQGECFNCGEEIPTPKLFCNGDCADFWQKYRAKSRPKD